jgi:hypothetical protein
MGIACFWGAFDRRFGLIYSFLYKMFMRPSAEKMMLKDRRWGYPDARRETETVDPLMGHH